MPQQRSPGLPPDVQPLSNWLVCPSCRAQPGQYCGSTLLPGREELTRFNCLARIAAVYVTDGTRVSTDAE